MIVDVRVRGWRLYLDLSKDAVKTEPTDHAPTQLATPMRVGPGFMTWQQIRAATQTEARRDGDLR